VEKIQAEILMTTQRILELLTGIIRKASMSIVSRANMSQMLIDNFITTMRETIGDEEIYSMIESGESQVVSNEVKAARNTLDRVGEQTRTVAAQTGQQERLDEEDDNDEYIWTLGSAHRHCPDCVSRDGRVEDMETWKLIGLPKDGWSVCNNYCTCSLKKVQK
jgi:hypothetical protein